MSSSGLLLNRLRQQALADVLPRQTKVNDQEPLETRTHDKVAELQVEMEDAKGMQLLDDFEELNGNVQSCLEVHISLEFKTQVLQALGHELHHNHIHACFGVHAVVDDLG